MSFFDSVGSSINRAIDYVVEKNRKAAMINRLKLVIRGEEKAAERAYISLGEYYYHHLRDEENTATEPACIAIDKANERLDRAITRLEEITAEPEKQDEDDFCSSCSGTCNSYCEADDISDEDENYDEDIFHIDDYEYHCNQNENSQEENLHKEENQNEESTNVPISHFSSDTSESDNPFEIHHNSDEKSNDDEKPSL